MSKTEKELAFLRDLYIEIDWTERFTNLFDENFKFSDEKIILYLDAGTGNHALALGEKLRKKKVSIVAVCENAELFKIAKAKADAVQTDVKFTAQIPDEKFDAVLADATLTKPSEAQDFLSKAAALSKKQLAFFLPTAGSFGEIYSLLWETLFNAGMPDKGAEIERLIAEIPTVSRVEEWAENAGLTKIETVTKNEFFDYENGEAFVNAPLVNDFILPARLAFLSAKEQEKVNKELAKTIDEDCQGMTFRFSIKATLIVGEKNI